MSAKTEASITKTGRTMLDSATLRGVAILSIVLHNYCHWLKGTVYENEFAYQSWHVSKLLNYLAHPDDRLLLQLFSFFGHYGVVIFIFLSAYGLEKKYGRSAQEVPIIPFIWTHYLKLLSMCVVGYTAYLLLNAFYVDYPSSIVFGILNLLSMLSNLQLFAAETYAPGPYWYFGLMLQLYIVYRLFFFRRSWGIIIGAILLSSIIQMVISPDGKTIEWLRSNCIGNILPFGIGLLYARYEERIQLSKTTYALVAVTSIVLIFMTSLLFIPWISTPIFVCTLGISFVKLLPHKLTQPIAWIGGISAAIFVSHPIVRQLVLGFSNKAQLSPHISVLMFITCAIVVGALCQPILQRSTQHFMKLAKKH